MAAGDTSRRDGASEPRSSEPGPGLVAQASPLRIVLLYVALSAAWILLSDRLLAAAIGDAASRGEIRAVHAALYLLVSAALLHGSIRRALAERGPRDAQLRGVLDGMADAVLVLDGSGSVVDVNRAALRLFGAGRREELLAPAAELLERAQLQNPDDRPAGADDPASLRALADESGARYEARLRRRDGRERYVSVSSAPVPPLAGGRDLSVVVVRDISEVKRFEESREEFFSTAAHEFKTPLAVVKAYAQLMRRRGQGDPAGLDAIVRQIDRLARMVQQLLEVARFRLGRTELRRERFDLTSLLDQSVDGMRPRVEGRRLLAAPTGPAPVIGDRDRIGQVIANLLENAIRFSPDGGDVEAALSRRGGEAVVSVRDHGLGIPPERQDRIFERYYRAHAGTAEDHGGLGVGLDVAREIVARHGGRIWFESAPGAGSTFSFSLPLAPEERPS